MRFPIDTSRLAFTVTSPPIPARDFSTKKAKVTDDGKPVMVVNLLAMDGTDSTKIKFNLPGEQNHLMPGQPVRVEGLCYGMAKDGDVRWWLADAVVPLGAAAGQLSVSGAVAAAADGGAPAAVRSGRNPLAAASRHGGAAVAGGEV